MLCTLAIPSVCSISQTRRLQRRAQDTARARGVCVSADAVGMMFIRGQKHATWTQSDTDMFEVVEIIRSAEAG